MVLSNGESHFNMKPDWLLQKQRVLPLNTEPNFNQKKKLYICTIELKYMMQLDVTYLYQQAILEKLQMEVLFDAFKYSANWLLQA